MNSRSAIALNRRRFLAAPTAISVSGLCPGVNAKNLNNKADFHPGHYIALKGAQRIAGIQQEHLEAVTGVSKRYRWVTLEPKPGEYDFSSIERDLKLLGRKQLVAFLIDKSHGQVCLPEHLHKYRFKARKGFCPKRWNPYYAERYVALATAIAAEFDDQPTFEGIAMQETALPASKETLAKVGYKPGLYKQNLLRMIISAKKAMKLSQFFWYANFIPSDDGKMLDQMIERFISHEVVVGGGRTSCRIVGY